MSPIKIVECPRDAMQGYHRLIPTGDKILYNNLLLKAGFDSLDFGSFVSPKAIPQMQDTEEVLESLDDSPTNLISIIANLQGAEKACGFDRIKFLGFPFSISETFQKRNTNASIDEAFERVKQISMLCNDSGKELIIYISMGFGNPYGDPWNHHEVEKWVSRFAETGIKTISLSDTIGIASPDSISYLFSELCPRFPQIEFGAHLHTQPQSWYEKVDAAYQSGCRRFDGALKGFGGCPMAEDKLTGNMPTENLLAYFEEKNIPHTINKEVFSRCLLMASRIFT